MLLYVYELIWNYENYFYKNLLSQKNHTFYEKFILGKFGAIRYLHITSHDAVYYRLIRLTPQ